ncbi:DNA-binding GntR family transcriptional regulator [Arthrobacter sp. SLBN-83]|uniref:GntR family transcriptional regulator n=1 Tax=Arthrobacter sp. SLBN-83 TaxID=2768449 RepID=UPI00115208AE|nr:GntR family transcriptional regulator [Arthrobacter sp. SLBN-83]TQJ58887.1 DNA-binding GntR family transcriptional regulator [Arthrobacter sp. SLBN-83]
METLELAEGRSLTAAELVSVLRSAIMGGELVPDQRLVEADLAAWYVASRGNVRAALAELTVEGLVERVQNRGARVRAVSVQEAVEITEVRAALEALCARKAAERISNDQAAELQELAERMKDAVERGDRDSYSEGNQTLHARLIELSGQQTAAATIHRLRGQAVRFQFRLARQPGRPAVSLPQHLAIIDAVCAHDPDAAADAMRVHLESVADVIRSTHA